MVFYCVTPPRRESEGEGLHITEWYSSKAALRQFSQVVRELNRRRERRSQLENTMPEYCSPFRSMRVTLEGVEIVDLPKRALALAPLNRRHYVVRRTEPKSDY